MLVFVMYYIYVTSGSSLLIESTDSMIIINQGKGKLNHLSSIGVSKLRVGAYTCVRTYMYTDYTAIIMAFRCGQH